MDHWDSPFNTDDWILLGTFLSLHYLQQVLKVPCQQLNLNLHTIMTVLERTPQVLVKKILVSSGEWTWIHLEQHLARSKKHQMVPQSLDPK